MVFSFLTWFTIQWISMILGMLLCYAEGRMNGWVEVKGTNVLCCGAVEKSLWWIYWKNMAEGNQKIYFNILSKHMFKLEMERKKFHLKTLKIPFDAEAKEKNPKSYHFIFRVRFDAGRMRDEIDASLASEPFVRILRCIKNMKKTYKKSFDFARAEKMKFHWKMRFSQPPSCL